MPHCLICEKSHLQVQFLLTARGTRLCSECIDSLHQRVVLLRKDPEAASEVRRQVLTGNEPPPLDDSLAEVSDMERKVLDLRFGLTDGRMRTVEETTRATGLTAEEIQGMEEAALRKLRPG